MAFEASRFLEFLVQPAAMRMAKAPQPLADCLTEIAEILAAGLMRLVARKSSAISAVTGESSLDLSAAESGDPTIVVRRKPNG